METSHYQRGDNVTDEIIRVVHVGGRGSGIGPVEYLFQLKRYILLSLFEADVNSTETIWNDFTKQFDERMRSYGTNYTIIPYCLSNSVGNRKFNINMSPLASSLYEMSPTAKNYTRMDNSIDGGEERLLYSEILKPSHIVEIKTTTLDHLYANKDIAMPHFISMDTQGSDYDILQGATTILKGDLMGIITESMYREFYKDQKLFPELFNFLKNYEFQLFDLYSPEYWYSGCIVGKGFLMTNEMLYLRNYQYFVRKDSEADVLIANLSKLAIIAYCFEKIDYAFEIIEYIMKNLQSNWIRYIKERDCHYLYQLDELYQTVSTLKTEQNHIPTYLEYAKLPVSQRKRKSRGILLAKKLWKDFKFLLNMIREDIMLLGGLCLPSPIKRFITNFILKG